MDQDVGHYLFFTVSILNNNNSNLNNNNKINKIPVTNKICIFLPPTAIFNFPHKCFLFLASAFALLPNCSNSGLDHNWNKAQGWIVKVVDSLWKYSLHFRCFVFCGPQGLKSCHNCLQDFGKTNQSNDTAWGPKCEFFHSITEVQMT